MANVTCYNSTKEIGPCDLVLIAVKTTSNSDLVDLIPPLLHERTMLLTLQNGLGNEEFLAEYFGAERVLGKLCFICLSRVSRTEIERYHYGHIMIGEYGRKPSKRTRAVASQFSGCGIKCSVVADLALEHWRKLVWNIPFNGLSILAGGIDTAAIIADAALYRETLALMDEVIDAAKKCGHALESAAAGDQIKRTKEMGEYDLPHCLIGTRANRSRSRQFGASHCAVLPAGAKTPRLEMTYAMLKSLDAKRR